MNILQNLCFDNEMIIAHVSIKIIVKGEKSRHIDISFSYLTYPFKLV